MSFKTLLEAICGLLLAAVLVAAVGWLCLEIPEYWLAISLGAFAGMVVMACLQAKKFKETDGESGGVVYADYYDVFKCLSVAAVPAVIIFFAASFAPDQIKSAHICAGLYIILMLLHIAYKTAQCNRFIMLPVVLVVKIGLSVIWVTAFYQMLNPSGKNRQSRRTNRTMAVMVMLMVTPLITLLVQGDEGKELIKARLRYRRFSGAGAVRDML
jgi:glycerol uptake facilitator-like aquaporin